VDLELAKVLSGRREETDTA